MEFVCKTYDNVQANSPITLIITSMIAVEVWMIIHLKNKSTILHRAILLSECRLIVDE